MPMHFQSLISGSSGNCLLLRTGKTTLLIDAGFTSQRALVNALGQVLPCIDGVVVSHLHGDHINFSALRVLEKHGVPLYIHEGDIGLLRSKHFGDSGFGGLRLMPFSARRFSIGELSIEPFQLPHEQGFTTFGFEVTCVQEGKQAKVVVATDFRDWRDSLARFRDADFLYVEANHDLDLLRKFPNYASRYHLSNPKCGTLLQQAFGSGGHYPTAVMLGHLSAQRNKPALALETVAKVLDEAGYSGIELHVAPRFKPSKVIRIQGSKYARVIAPYSVSVCGHGERLAARPHRPRRPAAKGCLLAATLLCLLVAALLFSVFASRKSLPNSTQSRPVSVYPALSPNAGGHWGRS